jgi:hypothetical protein
MRRVITTRHTDGVSKAGKKIGVYRGSDNNYYDIIELAPGFICDIPTNNIDRESKPGNRKNNYEVAS